MGGSENTLDTLLDNLEGVTGTEGHADNDADSDSDGFGGGGGGGGDSVGGDVDAKDVSFSAISPGEVAAMLLTFYVRDDEGYGDEDGSLGGSAGIGGANSPTNETATAYWPGSMGSMGGGGDGRDTLLEYEDILIRAVKAYIDSGQPVDAPVS